MNQNYEPKIGDKLSIGHNCWYKPYTVVEIKDENKIVVRQERAIYDDNDKYRLLGFVKAIRIEENPNGAHLICKKNKKGYWKVWGCPDDWADFGEWCASEYWD